MARFLNIVARLGHLPSILDAFFLASLIVVHGGTMAAAWCDVAMQFGFCLVGFGREVLFLWVVGGGCANGMVYGGETSMWWVGSCRLTE
jgi:hypothetical protein